MEGRRVKHHSIGILAHQELTEADLGELRQLFDSEYLKETVAIAGAGGVLISADARGMRLGG